MANPPLLVGAYGDDVARLHRLLRQQGDQLPASAVDRNYFGAATRQAILVFQQTTGLPATGAVDEHTAHLLASGHTGSGAAGQPGPGLGRSTRGVPGPGITSGAGTTETAGHLGQRQS